MKLLSLPKSLPRNIELILFDIDGTLIGPSGKLDDSTSLSLSRLAKHYKLGLCSGRPCFAAAELLATGFFEGPSVFFAGAALVDTGKSLRILSSLSTQAKSQLLAFCQKHQLHLEFYTPEDYFCSGASEYIDAHEHYIGKKAKITELTELPEEILKANILLPSSKESWVLEALKESELPLNYSCAKGAAHPDICFVNLSSPELSKTAAIEKACQDVGIHKAALSGFGDSSSDIELLRSSGLAVLVGEGNQELKRWAHFGCEPPELGGTSDIINTLLLSGK